MNFINELKWRGMVHDIMPGTEDMLSKGTATGYIGFDPTAASLTVGNLVTIMMLVHFQRSGHKPLALVGGATGMVGDPSGKTSERGLLSIDELRHNREKINGQLRHFLDFNCGPTSAEMVNNSDWFGDFGLLAFLRDVGKHVTVNYMLAKESVKARMTSGISYTEFTYQLIQGYDYLHLYRQFGCRLQMGGSDQWGNITTGTELIRRMDGEDAFAVTTPLLTKGDGTKFGKSESGAVWLDPELTTPYRFYQFWFNSSDVDVVKFIKVFSTKGKEEIDALIVEHKATPGARVLQKALAEEVTARVHGGESLKRALNASRLLFAKNPDALLGVSLDELKDVLEGVPTARVDRRALDNGFPIPDFLVATGVFASKGEARRMIQGGGVRINLDVRRAVESQVSMRHVLEEKLIWIKIGRKKNHIVYVE